MRELHPSRAAVVALARMRRDLHLAKQRVHFRDRQDTPGPHRSVAGHGRRDMIQPVAKARARCQARPVRRRRRLAGPGCRSCPRVPGSPGPASRSAQNARSPGQGPPSSASRAFQPVAIRLVQFDHIGNQQRLAGDLPALGGLAHPLEHEPFVGGMLVDNDEAVLCFGDDIGRRYLPASDAEGIGRDGSGRRFGPGCRCEIDMTIGEYR